LVGLHVSHYDTSRRVFDPQLLRARKPKFDIWFQSQERCVLAKLRDRRDTLDMLPTGQCGLPLNGAPKLIFSREVRADQFSRTIANEPGRAAGRTTHPEFRVALQPSPCRVVPSSGPVTGTDSVDPSAARKTPPLALRRPH